MSTDNKIKPGRSASTVAILCSRFPFSPGFAAYCKNHLSSHETSAASVPHCEGGGVSRISKVLIFERTLENNENKPEKHGLHMDYKNTESQLRRKLKTCVYLRLRLARPYVHLR